MGQILSPGGAGGRSGSEASSIRDQALHSDGLRASNPFDGSEGGSEGKPGGGLPPSEISPSPPHAAQHRRVPEGEEDAEAAKAKEALHDAERRTEAVRAALDKVSPPLWKPTLALSRLPPRTPPLRRRPRQAAHMPAWVLLLLMLSPQTPRPPPLPRPRPPPHLRTQPLLMASHPTSSRSGEARALREGGLPRAAEGCGALLSRRGPSVQPHVLRVPTPPWRQPRGKSQVNLPQMLPPGGSI